MRKDSCNCDKERYGLKVEHFKGALEEQNLGELNQVANTAERAGLEAIVSAIRDTIAMIEFSMNGAVLSASDRFPDMVGYTLPEIKGRHHRIFIDDDYKHSGEYQDCGVTERPRLLQASLMSHKQRKARRTRPTRLRALPKH